MGKSYVYADKNVTSKRKRLQLSVLPCRPQGFDIDQTRIFVFVAFWALLLAWGERCGRLCNFWWGELRAFGFCCWVHSLGNSMILVFSGSGCPEMC